MQLAQPGLRRSDLPFRSSEAYGYILASYLGQHLGKTVDCGFSSGALAELWCCFGDQLAAETGKSRPVLSGCQHLVRCTGNANTTQFFHSLVL